MNQTMQHTHELHYWVVVASRDHALSGVEQGIVQANHGKPGPLKRMQPGDRILLYAPKLEFGSKESYQRFVALGTVAEGEVYQQDVSSDFKPFRRKVMYQPVTETPIQPLIDQVDFIKNKKSWGYPFRFGCFAIDKSDYELIAKNLSDTSHD